MPDPAALAQAGPWAVVVAIGIGLGVAFVRGWFVARFVYDREVQRGDRGDKAVVDLTAAVKDLTNEIRQRRSTSRG